MHLRSRTQAGDDHEINTSLTIHDLIPTTSSTSPELKPVLPAAQYGFRSPICEVSTSAAGSAHLHHNEPFLCQNTTTSFAQEPSRCHHRAQDGASIPVLVTSNGRNSECYWRGHYFSAWKVWRKETKRSWNGSKQAFNTKGRPALG